MKKKTVQDRRTLIVDQLCCSHHIFVSKYSDVSVKVFTISDEPILNSQLPISGLLPDPIGSQLMEV